MLRFLTYFSFFFFNDTATTEIYTLSLHDALPISCPLGKELLAVGCCNRPPGRSRSITSFSPSTSSNPTARDRKSTRLNSSHSQISYAVFCLKKKKKQTIMSYRQPMHLLNTHGLTH